MSQTVIYRGILVEPLDRANGKILVRTKNPADAQKADIPFADIKDGVAVFEAWVPESDLVAV